MRENGTGTVHIPSETGVFCLNAIYHDALSAIRRVPLSELGDSHRLKAGQCRVMEKFYQLRTVPMHPASHEVMLESAVAGLAAEWPELHQREGVVIYAKTQTHNTFFDRDWLGSILIRQRLANWDVMTLSLNHCASALSALHLIRQGAVRRNIPIIVLTGEKAFHPEINRFTVGVQGELPVAALFNARPSPWQVTFTAVKHLSRFYNNADNMTRQEKADLNDCLLGELCDFVSHSVRLSGINSEDVDYFVPCNLNLPLLNQMAARLNIGGRLFDGNVADYGHLYCSDVLFNFSSLLKTTSRARNYFCFSIGMGVTLSCALIQHTDI
ncbi:3-oxoacyl-[acyl-carrier-protein] synthase III C-terminal domain-containing protein [Musicola keenii]|uniref:3-oxoacyl-[acyl-carrier-protein] synthase III C-terminal domain-containing protein n=1 Tax=Musicola keenii TaxID=2884250 RepID=UPI001787376A|nr:3-oxoacyl-[acyl-carrier-protein] synthase III C-terminal domain-containing protein [Musicola keenii]